MAVACLYDQYVQHALLDSGHFYDALPSVNSLLGSAIRFYGRYRCTSPVLFLCRLK